MTSASCDSCHGTLAWKPARFDHSTITSGCAGCHNGTTATGKPTGHMQTARECSACHKYPAWTPLVFKHTSSEYPGDHTGTNPTCLACHTTNTDQATWKAPAYRPACAGCHSSQYKPDPHTKYGNVKYTVSELRNCSGACHMYTDSTLTHDLEDPQRTAAPGDAARLQLMAFRRAQFLLALLLLCGAGPAGAQSLRLLDTSSVTERDDHLDLSIDFTCVLRYQTHSPASEGDQVRVSLRIGPDCNLPLSGEFAVERLLPADARGLVRSIELQPGLAGRAELVISWNRIEKFVLAPGTGMRGLRVRVITRPLCCRAGEREGRRWQQLFA